MLNLQVLRCLNSSASGVLYHYTNSMANVESIIENGLRTSAYPTANPEEYEAGVSFCRTKTTIPYAFNDTKTHGYADDESGSPYKRWVYGVIFSKNLLSNLGKLKPYEWMADMNWRKELNICKVNTGIQELPENWLPDVVTVSITAIRHGEEEDGEVKGKVGFTYPADTVDNDDYYTDEESYIVDDKPYLPKLPNGTPREEFDELVAKLDELGMSKTVPFDNSTLTLVWYSKDIAPGDINSQPDLIRKVARDALRIIKKRIQRRRVHQQAATRGGSIKVWVDYEEPVYLPDSGDTSYDTISKVLQQIAESSPKLTLRGSYEDGWRLWGYFSEKTFTNLPVTMQKILNRTGLSQIFESEDRLLVKDAKPGDYLPATKKAIVGIVVPRAQYYSKEVDAFRSKYPDIPVYVYAEKYEESNPSDKPIPREAYKNPVA